MLRSVSASVNALFGRVLPERRIFVKSGARTRYARLSPVFQLFAIAIFGGAAGWSGHLTAAHFQAELTQKGDRSALEAAHDRRADRLIAENKRLAEELSLARLQIGAQADGVGAAHAALTDAETRMRRSDSALTAHRRQLKTVTDERDIHAADLEAALQDVAALDAELTRLKAQQAELASAHTELLAALSDTVDQRNASAAQIAALDSEVTGLRRAFAVKTDQQDRIFSRLEDATKLSLGSLEDVFAEARINMDEILTAAERDYSGAGGVFAPVEGAAGFQQQDVDGDRLGGLLSDMERVNLLRFAVDKMPFMRPVGAARFTSGFGSRKDPFNGRRAFHAGIDFAAPRGTAIKATGSGVVVASERQRGYGNIIKIRHAFGYETVYAHLHRRRVKVGDVVERGDRIGDMGNTGRSTGTHLHYEIRLNGKPVNPAKYIEAARHVL